MPAITVDSTYFSTANIPYVPNFYSQGGSSYWGRALDGDLSIGNATYNINGAPPSPAGGAPSRTNYAVAQAVTAIDGTATQLTVGDTTDFYAGDEVLVANARGSSGATTNAGVWERRRVASVTSTVITLSKALDKTYGNSSNSSLSGQKVIVQRLPEYGNVTLTHANARMTAPAWDGSKGGYTAFLVRGTLSATAAGAIGANGTGFLGGTGKGGPASAGAAGESFDGLASLAAGQGGAAGSSGTAATGTSTAGGGGGGGNGGGAGGGGRHQSSVAPTPYIGGGAGGGGGATNGPSNGNAGGSANPAGLNWGTGGSGGGQGGDGHVCAISGVAGSLSYGQDNMLAKTFMGSGGGGVGAGGTGGAGGTYPPAFHPGGLGSPNTSIGGRGGGGGAGSVSNGPASPTMPAFSPSDGQGGAGGGILMVWARTLSFAGSAFSFTATGGSGSSGQPGGAGGPGGVGTPAGDAGGGGGGGSGSGGAGGGAGGSILIFSSNVLSASGIGLSTSGGSGGTGGSGGAGGPGQNNGATPVKTSGAGGPAATGPTGGAGNDGRTFASFYQVDSVPRVNVTDGRGTFAPSSTTYTTKL